MDTREDDHIEKLEFYRLDYEMQAVAAGGEILQPGDHVYMWCTLYQHHGIVINTNNWKNDFEKSRKSFILIAEFTNVALLGAANSIINSASTASGAVSEGVAGGFRFVQETEPGKWHKVKYNASLLECSTWRPGTCSASSPSTVQTILTRVLFLRDCPHLIPHYHILASNCETVAVWCITGNWETSQGDRALQVSKLGAVTAAAAAVPICGIAVAGGLAIWESIHLGKKKEETAQLLNKEFQWYALGKTPEFSSVDS